VANLREVFPPERVLQIVDEHDLYMTAEKDNIGLANAILLNRFWLWWIGWYNRINRSRGEWRRNGTEIEVNRLWKEVSTYKAALYPRANRVVCSPDPMERGDANVATVALNAWWSKKDTHRRMLSAVEMALIFPGCAFKIGYDPGRGTPIERVWMRVLPPWEVVLDRNATDLADERYRGHLYDAPIPEIEERFPRLAGKLKGHRRRDFIDSTENASTAPSNETNNPDGQPQGVLGDDQFVRVFEFLNLKDTVVGPGGDVYIGRLEVYILDQSEEVSRGPVYVGPLPFATADGRHLPNIEPLLFANEPGFPFRGVAPIARLLAQQVELNRLRTSMAEMVRRDQRKLLLREGALEQDEIDKLMDGIDMNAALVKDPTTPLADIYHMIPTVPVSADYKTYMALVEQDFTRVAGSSPAARGEITKATAFETQQVQLYTESDLGFHGLLLADCSTRLSNVVLAAMRGAMQDSGDSDGEEDNQERLLAPVGSVHDAPTLPPDEAVAGADAAAAVGGNPPALGPDASSVAGAAPEPPSAIRKGPVVAMKQQAFQMKDRDLVVTVTVAALTGDFEINQVEGGRTPLTDQSMLQFLTGPGIQGYFALAQQMAGPDKAQSVVQALAAASMAKLAEIADLPKDMHPEELLAKAKEAPKPKPAPQLPDDAAPPPTAAAPPSAPPAPALQALTTAFQALAQVAGMGPQLKAMVLDAGRAVSIAMQAARAGDATAAARSAHIALTNLAGLDIGSLPGPAQQAIQTAGAALQSVAPEAPDAPQPTAPSANPPPAPTPGAVAPQSNGSP